MSYFDNFENRSSNKDNIFNKGNAGECKASLQVTVVEAGTAKKDGGLVANTYYVATFTDLSNSSARPITSTIFPLTNGADGSSAKAGTINSRLSTAKHLYLACGGNVADLPNPGADINVENANLVLTAMMQYVVSKTQMPVNGRGYFHYAKGGRQDAYLNYRDGFKNSFTTDPDYVFETSDLIFLSRPPAANSTSNASSATPVENDLPF